MRVFIIVLTILTLLSPLESYSATPPFDTKTAWKNISKRTVYRGWDHLVYRLMDDGVSHYDIKKIYQSSKMPRYSRVSFAVEPQESRAMYTNFRKKGHINLANSFLKKHKKTFDAVEKKLPVNRHVIASIMLVETHTGRFTGNSKIIYRLSRLAGIADPSNMVINYYRLKTKDPKVKYREVERRGKKLEEMFTPEISALIKIANSNKYDVFGIRGSSAGAFGLPQFLPSSYLRFGLDGNKDGKVSLYNPEDAIWSVANFLKHFDWKDDLSRSRKEKVIWHYNRSEAYVDTVLDIESMLARK